MATFTAQNATDMTKIVLQTLDPSLFGNFQSVDTSPTEITYNFFEEIYDQGTLEQRTSATYGFGGAFSYDQDSSSNITGINGNVTSLSSHFEERVYYNPINFDYFVSAWEISGFDLDVSTFQTTSTQAILAEIFSGNDIIRGSVTQPDYLLGFDGDDLLIGNGGIANNTRGGDTLDGGAGADIMIGGVGNTTYYIDNVLDVVTEEYGGGKDTVYCPFDYVLGQALDNLFLTGAAKVGTGNEFINQIHGNTQNNTLTGGGRDDVLEGSAGNDLLDGGADDDRLYGGDGDDVLIGGSGVNFFDGGAGIDTADYRQSETRIWLFLGTTNSSGDGFIDMENLLGTAFDDYLGGNISVNLIHGYDGDDIISGDYGDDRLYGDSGNDQLFGGTRSDELYGGSGDDVLNGGEGADILDGGAGSDTVIFDANSYGIIAHLADPSLNSNFDGDVYISIENLGGSFGTDRFYGDGNANILSGAGGDDTLSGDAGNDTLIGGVGKDTLLGGEGTDTASYAGASARIIASLANASINTGDAAGDTYTVVENVTGTDFDDYVYGNSSNNLIDGGFGDDILKGYDGNDHLIGNRGKDTFVFNTALNAATNVDSVQGFKPADDVIWVDNLFFTGLKTGALASSAFHIGTAAADASDRIIYDASSGKLSFDVDGVGGAGATQFALLSKNLALTYADFIVI